MSLIARATVAVAVLCVSSLAAQTPDDRSFTFDHWWERLAALRREDGRHGTFGPVGRRLWITRSEPVPGLVGHAHFLHHTPELRDPLRITMRDEAGRDVALRTEVHAWEPTHGDVRWAGLGNGVIARRWITDDDVYVERLTVHGPARFRVGIDAPWTPQSDAPAHAFASLRLSDFADVDLRSDASLRIGALDAPVWIEGEAFARQTGSQGLDRKALASGGHVLGNEFGAKAGHTATWRFVVAAAGPQVASIRYARAIDGEAAFTLAVGPTEIGVCRFPSTGGWGSAATDFRWVDVALGSLPIGVHDLVVTAKGDTSNVNLDALRIGPVGVDAGIAGDLAASRANTAPALRGALLIDSGTRHVDGVPFQITDAVGRQGVRLTDDGLRVPLPRADLRRLHVLVVGLSANAELRIGAQHHAVPERTAERPFQRLSLVVEAGDAVTVAGRDCLLLAATQAVDDAATGAAVRRRGRARFHGVDVDIACVLRGVPQDDVVDVADGASVTFDTALAFAVGGDATAAARNAIGGDAFARHHASSVQWYVDHAPRLNVHADTARERLRYENLWTYRWFLLRHNLAHPNAGHLTGGPVFYEGRHGSWYPRVISFSTPHIVAEARWLRDPSLWSANVRAHVDHIDEVGELRNVLVHWRGFRYTNWIGAATVDALKVHPDRPLAERLLPALIRNVTGQVAHHDRDGDGVLAPGDHYTTGMEFQPSFWFFDGYDNRKPQAELERPDFTSYVFGNAVALAEAARWLDRDDDARAMDAVAAKLRAGTLDKLWNDGERFFLSIRERDDAPALTPEVIGFYPFRFALPPDEPRYRAAFDALVDPTKFWTPFPPASCSRTVPVFSAAVQRWPGPGGLVTPCMWNGPTWPHATSLVADAMGVALRRYEPSAVTAQKLGELLDAYARFHFEDGDPSRPLLREYGDGETGVNWGCADYLHSTWIDLLIRHAIGLQPRLDDTLEVHRLPLRLPAMSVMGLRYHGHVVDIDTLGGETRVYVDGVEVGRSDGSRRALLLPGVLTR